MALKGVDVPVLVKNPVNPDLELWIGALERINQAGITRLGVIHRGFSAYEKRLYRNPPMWHIPIELRRRIPNLPIFGDPSHMGGARELIAPLSQQAMDLGYDGLIVESHCRPDDAWSDARQQVTPDVLDFILYKRGAQGVLCGMSSDFIKDIFEHIHEESVRQQIEVLNKD